MSTSATAVVGGPPGSAGQLGGSTGGSVLGDEGERKKVSEPWRKYASKWEAWAGSWSAKNDTYILPRLSAFEKVLNIHRILSLHLNYAMLFTASPVFMASPGIWAEMAQSHDGYSQLERGRDAAFAVIQAICSVRQLLVTSLVKIVLI